MAVRVGYQGMPGAYSQSALLAMAPTADVLAGKEIETVPVSSFKSLLTMVQQRELSYAIVPIDNSLSGSFHNVYELLVELNLCIVAEYVYREELCLMVLPGTDRADLRQIRTHPHTIEQCSKFINGLVDVDVVPTTDTAGAASYVKENGMKAFGAIASRQAADLYGLSIIESGLEDDPRCSTRYFLVSADAVQVPPSLRHQTRMSMCVTLANMPGALFKAISCFALRDINVCKIESRPKSQSAWAESRASAYAVYIDIDCSHNAIAMENAMANLNEFASNVKVLGQYVPFRPSTGQPNGART